LTLALTDAFSERVRDLEGKSLRAKENKRIRGAASFEVSALAGVGVANTQVNSEAGKLNPSPQRHSRNSTCFASAMHKLSISKA
jgi:hypothetical protein